VSHRSLTLLIAALLLLAPLWLALAHATRTWCRRHRDPRGLPPAERSALRRLCPLYARTPSAARAAAEERTLELLAMLRFMGCAGLAVTRTMRVLIAYQASLLLARLGTGPCRELGAVLIYPDDFVAPRTVVDAAGVVTEAREPLSGETVDTARIVLSWAEVRAGLAADDGRNVVLHEFAHFLDHALDSALSRPGRGPGPRALLARELAALRSSVAAGERTLIDPYGAQDPAEFFAVVTETFFERPAALRARHPELYRTLAGVYALDPAGWS
jgi:Mlc titration factor MtfA (ptsG expression regulator)